MLDKWTGTAVGKMHVYGISQSDLAERLGVTSGYVSALLNQRERPKDAKKKINDAIAQILAERGEIETR